MESLFDLGVSSEVSEHAWAVPYLQDVREFRKRAVVPSVDGSLLTQGVLSQLPGMEWLNAVGITLVVPESEDVDVQRRQLSAWFPVLKSEAVTVLSHRRFPDFYPEGFECPVVAVDTETTGLDTRLVYDSDGVLDAKVRLVSVAIAPSAVSGYYFPVRHSGSDGCLNWCPGVMAEFLTEVHDHFVCVYHNAMYDREVLSFNGVRVRGWPYFLDTMALDFLRDPNSTRSHGLKWISENVLQRKMVEIHELFLGPGSVRPGGRTPIYFEQLPVSNALVYGTSDAINTFALLEMYMGLEDPYNAFTGQTLVAAIDHRAQESVRLMVRAGMPVQYRYAYFAALDSEVRIHQLQEAMYSMVGRRFDINSVKDLSVVLFDDMQVPPPDKPRNKLGVYPTDADTLESLFERYPEYPMLALVVFYRRFAATLPKFFCKFILNSFTDHALPWMRVKNDYSLTVVPTGRLSSSSSGSRERVRRSGGKSRTNWVYERDSWQCGFNSQGVPSDPYFVAPARRVTGLPEGVTIGGVPVAEYTPYSEGIRQSLLRRVSEI